MNAITLTQYGNSKDLATATLPVPTPKPDEVLVRIHGAAVNLLDLKKASGFLKAVMPLSFPWIPGIDFSGTVESIGSNVTNFKKGDEVYGANLAGGTYAEYLAVHTDVIAHKPKNLNFLEAASVPVAAETAWQTIQRHAAITPGQTILIHGGNGAVGAYAIQIAHQAGAHVITTAAASYKEHLQTLGADEVIDYTTTSFASAIEKVDTVIDTVGGDTLLQSIPLIKKGGLLITLTQPAPADLVAQQGIRTVFSQLQPNTQELAAIAEKIDNGSLKIALGNVYPLAQAAEAWDELAGNLPAGKHKKSGRVVLDTHI